VHLTLAVGLLKGAQMDHVVREATALGVSAIVPVASAHVVTGKAGRDASVERWRRIAVAAAKQSARAVVPVMSPVVEFEALLHAASGTVLVCLEPARAGGEGIGAIARPDRALLCVGPEGGWSETDLAVARARGARFVALGPRTLRAETAPTVALASLWTVWGW
jgi:16S rRNA (uracil1498-N3)-methyltransferase